MLTLAQYTIVKNYILSDPVLSTIVNKLALPEEKSKSERSYGNNNC